MALKRRYIVVKVFRALYLLALSIVLLLGLALVLLQNPGVQTWLSDQIVGKVFSGIDGNVTYEKIHFKPFNTIVIKNMAIKDKRPYIPPEEVIEKWDDYQGPCDTLFAAEYVIVRFSIWGLVSPKKPRLNIEKAEVKNGIFVLVIEDGRTSLERMLHLPKDRGISYNADTTAASLAIHIANVELDNVDYVMLNYKRQISPIKNPGSVNWANMHCYGVTARGKDLLIDHGVISGTMKSCSFREKCGIQVSQVAADFSIREGYVNIENIFIRDQYSETHVPFFRMIYDGAVAFNDYIHNVRMYGKMDNTVVDSRTIDFFSDITGSEGLKVCLNGYFDGTVSDFRLKNLDVKLLDEAFSARLDARATGLPLAERTRFDVRIADLQASDRGLEKIIRVFGRQRIDLPDNARIHKMDTHIHGHPNDIRLNMELASNLGDLSLKGQIAKLIEPGKDGQISLQVQTNELRLDRLSDSNDLGTMNLIASLEVNLDKKDALNSQVAIDSIVVDKIGLLGYDYGPIDIRGNIRNKDFEGSAVIQDENLKFYFNGLATLLADQSGARYHFKAGISYADLQALGLDNRGRSRIHLDMTADVDINEKREMAGRLDMEDIHLENEVADYDLGNIQARAFMDNGLARILVGSEMLEAHYTGSRSILHFLGVSLGQILYMDNQPWDSSSYDLSLQCRDSEKMLAWLFPGMYISNGSSVHIQVDGNGRMNGNILCDNFVIDEIDISKTQIILDNREHRINAGLSCQKIDLGQFNVDDIALEVWTDLSQKDRVNAGCDSSHFTVGPKLWTISPSRLQISKDSGLLIDRFALEHQDEGFFIHGTVATPAMSDSLSIRMNNFDLGLISGFMNSEIPAFDGIISGEAVLGRKNGRFGAEADIICVNSQFDNQDLGTLLITSQWEEDIKRYALSMDNSYNHAPTFQLDASYSPYNDDYFLSGDFNAFELGIFRSFVKDIFNRLEGQLSGLVTIEGNFKDSGRIRMGSKDLRLSGAHLGIDYTKVAYQVESRLKVDNNGVSFIDALLKDRAGATGKLTGGILWNDFKQLSADLHIAVDKMELLDIKEKDKDQYSFYGHIFGSGNLDITGPFNAITLDVRANTTGIASDFNLSMEGSSQSDGSSLLKFRAPEPTGKKVVVRRKVQPRAQGDLKVKLALDVTRDVTAHIDIDKFNGSRITANGKGRILIDVRPTQDLFKLNGNYEIEEGKVRFVALGLTARDFTVSNGSSVSFGGDVMETALNIDAIYKTKASLAAIISDSTAVSSRRVVECGIKVTDKLKNPHVAFSIHVPDLEPTIKTRVESAFSTEDKVQRQFLALLITGTFIPDEQGGVQDNTTALYGNLSELMTTQINNIFMKLDIPLDLGFNYQPSSTGTSIFDVAVSTQLFNNRVVVNGNIGSKQRMTGSGNRNEVVGDIDIEVKINRSGTLRTSAFSHSADQFTNFLDNLQRIGVGISWQQEFNHFGHYVRNLFTKREARSILEQQEEMKRRQRGNKRVTITE
ncbi:MAG: translocation/assembly module TamB domain-containing protein [Bacteroidales bacterium]|nr:translocation/assembly module TamB domain-containing protein [Bacteroidales bacterium]